MTPRPTLPTSLLGIPEAVQKAGSAQARASTADGKLQAAGQGTDPNYVTSPDRFQSMSFDQLYKAVHGEGGLDPSGLQGQAGVWRQSSSDVLNLSVFNLMGMTRLFNEGQWQGATADAGQAATEGFVKALNEIGQVFGSVAARVEAVGYAAEAVKLAVQPAPVASGTFDPDNPSQQILPGLSNPATVEQNRESLAAARDSVIQALDTTYTPVFPPSGTGVPAYVDMPVIGGGDPGGANPGAGGSNGQNGGPGADQGSPASIESAATTPAPTETEDSSQSSDQSSGDDSNSGQDSGDAATDPSSTAPAGTDPAATQAGSPSPGSGGPGSGSPGSGGPGSGSPGSGGPGSGSPGGGGSAGGPGAVLGRAVPGVGTPTAGPGIAAAAGSGAGAGGRNGMMPGMGGAGGAGRGGNREESEEHYAPEYLRGVHPDWTEGILTYEGVIGGEVELMSGVQSSAPAVPNRDSPTTAATAPAAEAVRQQPVSAPMPVSTPHDSARESGAAMPPVSSPRQGRTESPTPVDSMTTPAAAPTPTEQPVADQFFEHSGAGPMLADEPAPAETPAEEQFFEHSGVGPMLADDEPPTAPRQ
ncbi:hypothetical protein ACFWUP_30600 [Nocardia sp. NPDC058658]|uniref:hypothetical protein n=1 Tax=Nocardia sp. NPDC058658 TaxID=3346580 RepID=UPI00364F7CFF